MIRGSTFGHPLISFIYPVPDDTPMGQQFTFIHCADLHLGSRFKGLGDTDPALASKLRESVKESFERIIDAAVSRDVDALVISGDVYDDRNELPSTRLWFSEQLSRLRKPVFICKGNHDSDTSWDRSIAYPGNVHVFGTEPERIPLGDGFEIIGVSYSTSHETRNLASMIQGDAARFTIACLHCDLESVSEGYPYAPCSMSDLLGRSVDYWALGHIHRRCVVSKSPYIVYPGNIQGRSFKETGPKGANIVTVRDRLVTGFEFIPTQSYEWADLTVDIGGKTLNDVVGEISSATSGQTICRITFTGSGELDRMLRINPQDVMRAISRRMLVSSMEVRTAPPFDLESRSDGKDMAAALIRAYEDACKLSKEQVVDIICRNKVARNSRDFYMSMSEDELHNLLQESLLNILAKMEGISCR